MARTRAKRGASRLGERPVPAPEASRRRKATIGEASAIAGRAGLNPKSEAKDKSNEAHGL